MRLLSFALPLFLATTLVAPGCSTAFFAKGSGNRKGSDPTTYDEISKRCREKVPGWHMFKGQCRYVPLYVVAGFAAYARVFEVAYSKAKESHTVGMEQLEIWDRWSSDIKQAANALAESISEVDFSFWMKANLDLHQLGHELLVTKDAYHQLMEISYAQLQDRDQNVADRLARLFTANADKILLTEKIAKTPYSLAELNTMAFEAESDLLQVLNLWNSKVNTDDKLKREISALLNNLLIKVYDPNQSSP